MEDLLLKRLVQIVPSTGLWIRRTLKDGQTQTFPGAEFTPVVAIGLVKVEAPHDRFFLSEGVVPLTAEDLAMGVIETAPNEGLIIEQSIYHDVDFEELGFRLKDDAKPRNFAPFGRGDTMEYAYILQDREQRLREDSRS